MIQKTDDMVWLRCPCCGAELPFDVGSAPAVAHIIECLRSIQAEAHPEVGDEQLELGCEQLAPKAEDPDVEDPEAQDDHYSHK